MGAGESHRLRGAVDRPALIAIRGVFEEKPTATAKLDDFLDPQTLKVRFDDGLCNADSARIDVEWTTRGDYKFHYTDSTGVDCRWDRHPHDGDYTAASGFEHFHPPPDASADPAAVEASCIEQPTDTLVARAVLKLWRAAYSADSLIPLNAGRNPP